MTYTTIEKGEKRMNILQLRKCLGAIGVALVFGVVTAFGCKCIIPDEPVNDKILRAYINASGVFTGKVVALEYQKGISNGDQEEVLRSEGKPLDFETQVVKFEVNAWWKTEMPPIFYLATGTTKNSDGTGGTSDCEHSFEIGKAYMVYAAGRGRETRTYTCTRTAPLSQAQDDLNLLGPGKKPRDDNK